MTSQNGVLKTKSADALKQINASAVLCALFDRPASNDVHACLQAYDFAWHFKKANQAGTLTLDWAALCADADLKALCEHTKMRQDIYCQTLDLPDSHIFMTFSKPGYYSGYHIWHKDACENIVGLETYNPQAQTPSGQFEYAGRNEELFFKKRSDGLEYTALKQDLGQKADHGRLVMIQHGDDGLLHRAGKLLEGYRVRTLLVPK